MAYGSPHNLVEEFIFEENLSINNENKEDESVEVTGVENRNFLTAGLGDFDYQALYVSGSTLSLVSRKIATKFQNSLEPAQARIESAMGTSAKCLGELKMCLVLDGTAETLRFKAMDNLTHDILS